MASQRLTRNITAELTSVRRDAEMHEKLYTASAEGKSGWPANGVVDAEMAEGHFQWWERYTNWGDELAGFLALAEAGQTDTAIKAAGYDPEHYRIFR
jgi:hypothetical protein